jgi:glutamate synthase (NADPH/NADH) small chain
MAKKVIIKEKTPMPVLDPQMRIEGFEEVALGYTEEMALQEAQRCIQCRNRSCVDGCPVEVPIPEFISLIAERKYKEALQVVKEKNVLPGICGRVCPQETQCEALCSLGRVKGSQPVAIGRLERFLADWDMANAKEIVQDMPSCSAEEEKTKVAIIGSGPAGLTCAGELANRGYDATIFEAFHTTGGVLVYGIPEFRLPKEIVRKEIEKLKQYGVEIKVNSVVGKTLTLDDLRMRGYKAFFVGVGAGLPSFLKIPGTELNGVLSANEYLTRVNLMKAYDPEYDTMVDFGQRVAVFGGGNVAMDAARTALRLGAEQVMIVYRRSESELPAREEEYEHAIEEGVEFHFLRNPTAIIGDENGFVKQIEVIKMELGSPDASGRRRPVAVPGSEYILDVDLVIMAIGANANPLLTKNTPGLKLNRWGYIEVSNSMQTSIPDVFAGGDIVTGAATVISAMGAGKQAAESIHKYLQGELEPMLEGAD